MGLRAHQSQKWHDVTIFTCSHQHMAPKRDTPLPVRPMVVVLFVQLSEASQYVPPHCSVG